MDPHQHLHKRKVILLFPLFVFIISTLISAAHTQNLPQNHQLMGRSRILLDLKHENHNSSLLPKKPKPDTKNQTKLIKPSNSSKIIKPLSDSPKNKTKIIKNTSSSFNNSSPQPTIKSHLKKLNSTSNSTKKLAELPKLTPPKNKTTKSITVKETKPHLKKPILEEDEDEEEDFVSEFRDLPSKFQETFLPDMEEISKTSKFYLTRYNKEFTKGFKPYVGNKYAATIASSVSFAFIIIPLILVSLIFSRITAYFSLQKFLIFIQIYLAIYFTILALSSLVTGLEPLKFFYTTSQSTYVCVQVLQTLAYVLYLLLLLMYLVLVFSTETGIGTKLLGLAQTFVGFAVGLHYYITVFHRAVLHQPPKASWKVHALYATCFVVICLLGQVDRRKKAYLEDGGEEGKRS